MHALAFLELQFLQLRQYSHRAIQFETPTADRMNGSISVCPIQGSEILRDDHIDAHWSRHSDDLTGRFKRASFLVNTKGNEVVGALIRREQESSRWINGEASGILALGQLVADVAESSRLLVNLVDHDAVVSSVGAIEICSCG